MGTRLTKQFVIQWCKEHQDKAESTAVRDAENGNSAALRYLRSVVEYHTLPQTPRHNEDGACAGFGCDTVLVR